MVQSLKEHYSEIRKITESLAGNLQPEDTVVQPEMDVSPPKWHLAHTTWFFENFILKKFLKNYKPFHPSFDYLFNSYYQSQGIRVNRNMRGFHPRPLLNEVLEYRYAIDKEILSLLNSLHGNEFESLVELGIHHEQQHQELFITDLKYIWGKSPLYPVYTQKEIPGQASSAQRWLEVEEGLFETGYSGYSFHFDNEEPRHKIYLSPFKIGARPALVGEYIEFIKSGAYNNWKYWLHEGWDWVVNNNIKAPLYWENIDDNWYVYTLSGFRRVKEDEILTHISFYEADAFARWSGNRLPTEQEWEVAASIYGNSDASANFLEQGFFNPTFIQGNDMAFMGQVWEWTNSSYLPYPGFKPWSGDVGEYNGKFMINQMVLRGGSCATPQSHIRTTYRNFFHPHLRWQFTGIRLARD